MTETGLRVDAIKEDFPEVGILLKAFVNAYLVERTRK